MHRIVVCRIKRADVAYPNLVDDGPNSYFYDAESRLYKINSTDVQYAYDDAGRRIKRKITIGASTVTTYYVYGLTGLMSEFSTTTGASGAASTRNGRGCDAW